MNRFHLRLFHGLICGGMVVTSALQAAVVGPAGYTNSFASQPPATDWATVSVPGSNSDGYDMDTDVNNFITPAVVTGGTSASGSSPVGANAVATWSSAGFLQTRATGNRFTVLMGKFVNGTGTNITQAGLSYNLTFAGNVNAEDPGKGTRVYFSTSGTNWSNFGTLNSTLTSGSFLMATNFTVDWPNGASLYILFADDNGIPGTDVAYEIDNFSLRATAGAPPDLNVAVNTPTNNSVLPAGFAFNLTATAAGGSAPFTVRYFTNSGAGNLSFALAGTSTTAPYVVPVSASAGIFHVYAVATDSAGSPATATSRTNTITIVAPIFATLTAPTNDSTFDNNTVITGEVSVSGGTAPYSVQFFLDGAANGAAVTSAPYQRSFGALFVGDHLIAATVTDARGWTSNTLASVIHISGPLGSTLTPTNGAQLRFGQPVNLAAAPGGGTAPYTVTFFTNDQPIATLTNPPFALNIGILPPGTYSAYAHVVDGVLAQANSSTNTFTVLPNPLVVSLNSPANGSSFQALRPIGMAVTATVLAPLSISNVTFYFDGAAAGIDGTLPYSLSVTTAVTGAHTVYAMATDSLGRTAFSATNQITVTPNPLANDNFANRLTIDTIPASISANNTGATTEAGERTVSRGATLWWKWVAPIDGTVVVDMFDSTFDTYLGVFTGTAVNALTLIAENDDDPNGIGGLRSWLTFSARAGTEYEIQAGGFSSNQGEIQLHVSMPVFVSITNPVNLSTFPVGTNVTVSANAFSPAGPIVRVDFFRDFSLIASDSNAPFSFVITNAPLGTNALYAIATDNLGQMATSAVVNVLFVNPGLTITYPSDGGLFLPATEIPVSAVQQFTPDTITNVQFFIDGIRVAEAAGPSVFNASLTNLTAGNHRLSAVGRSDAGAVYNSQTISIGIVYTLISSNAVWSYLDNGSDQGTAWIAPNFDDHLWSRGPAPLGYGDSDGRPPATVTSYGPDANNKYATTYFRHKFFVESAALITNGFVEIQRDDGAIIYLNGTEIGRFNMPGGAVASTTFASANANDDGTSYFGLGFDASLLHDGTNVMAVEIHQDSGNSSDIWMVMEAFGIPATDSGSVPPRIAGINPPPGNVLYLTNVTITFSEPVTNIDAGDLLVNGVPAAGVTGSNATWTFRFPRPAYGNVAFSWAPGNGIVDFDSPPKPFDGSALSASFSYTLLNPLAPTVAGQSPIAGATVTNLSQIAITFSKPVAHVDAADLLVNGVPAADVSGGPFTYTFTFVQPAEGSVSITWAANHGITDVSQPPDPFDPLRPGSTWSYQLVDRTPPTIVSRTPVAGASVTNLTSLAVAFSEAMRGVDASDLLLNGVPAAGLTANSPSNFTFTFAPPNGTVINVTWAAAHGITDSAITPNAFNATGPGAAWSYSTPDTVAPVVAGIDPPPFVTVRSLTQVRLTFSEAVTGVDAADLLMNDRPALSVSGSGVGPYTFLFSAPTNGTVNLRWAPAHGITDLATPANAFGGGAWSYILDPNASFAGSVVINEIMFDPLSGRPEDEWVELANVTSSPINLTGWQFTKGIDFTFPNVSLPANGYLVVAANPAAFQSNYPLVTNVVGGWSGSLNNNGETIALKSALGDDVASVQYASEGDWARRERGSGAILVTSITRSGNTATATAFNHGYSGSDQVVISGADQAEYNGRFTISSVPSRSTFTFTVAGSPATPASGTIVSRWVLDDGYSGWAWFSAADGFGSSLEAMNPRFNLASGQNWGSSLAIGGSPGRENSVYTNNVAPLILTAKHFPAVPKSTDPVGISARIVDEAANGVSSVQLFYRNHTTTAPGSFVSTNMLDDGLHDDGAASDGSYGVVLPAMANGTIIEFYIQASDATGHVRTWPAPVWETNGPNATFGTLVQGANALFMVDNEVPSNNMPVLRFTMTRTESLSFPPNNRNSDAAFNGTLVAMQSGETDIRYLCDVRVRGAGTRTRNPSNNRLDIPNDNPWNGRSALNLNSQFVHAQLLGNVIAEKAGLLTEMPYVVQYRINGVNPAPLSAPVNGSGSGAGWGTFILLRPMDGDLASEGYPDDGSGNTYRASSGTHTADLSYQGTNPTSYLGRGYFKTSNRTENDWSDLFNLTAALSYTGANSNYVQLISTNVNVENWMTYFALSSLLNDGETKLGNGLGDDYGLYRGVLDRRFILQAHDFDTIFGEGDTGSGSYPINTNSSIFLMLNPPNPNANVPVLRRFMTNNAFAPLFYAELKRLADTVFNPTNLGPLIDQHLSNWGLGPDANVIQRIKNYAENRRQIVLSQIPLNLTIESSLGTSSGYLFTTAPTVTLSGSANAIETRTVLVNGVAAGWSGYDARWNSTLLLQPGINHVLVQSLDSNNVEFASASVDIWYNSGTPVNVSGAISTDTLWSAAGGPYLVAGNVTVNNGVTLTIQPGTSVYLNPGTGISVANGGKLIAEGLPTVHIRFTRSPGSSGNWGNIVFNGAPGSVESRLAYADFEFNANNVNTPALQVSGGTVFFDHLTFGNTGAPYIHVDGASFVIQNCVFPTATAGFELVHGVSGIKAGGRGLFLRNYFGVPTGYNDVVDFTGGNRPGQPVVQFIDNVFVGASDDILDLDGTDAWVEGNLFLHTHKNGSPDSSSAISGGLTGNDRSEITIVGNLFYDCDQVANAKEGNFYTFYNNTIVHQNHAGGTDTNGAVGLLADVGTQEGAGMYFEGNIIYDAEQLIFGRTNAVVTFTNNLFYNVGGPAWTGPGGSNVTADPLLSHVPTIAETTSFGSWASAQVLRDWFSLRSGSPAIGTGPNGRDKGGVVPLGASIAGEPEGTTSRNSAVLTVGLNRSGSGITSSSWTNGSGFVSYKWRLDGGVWSPETPISAPITLNNLANGPHYVEVTGKRDSLTYQDDAVNGPDAVLSRSRTWFVDASKPALRINEVLASNTGSVLIGSSTPDLIELYNDTGTVRDLAGMGFTDDPSRPYRYVFPPGTLLPSGAYLVIYANNPDGNPGIHVGFNLSQAGGSLYLYDSLVNGGSLVDSVTFGTQLPDLSVGRLPEGSWALCIPTFGFANRGASLGDPRSLRINEWLANGVTPFDNDFIEIYNPDTLPVDLGGLYLSDEIVGARNRHRIAPLTFISGQGYYRFLADSDASQGAEHLNFKLTSDQGSIGLYLPDLSEIDSIVYQPQNVNISQGRSPNGGSAIVSFDTPTPGAPNPVVTGPAPFGNALVINEVLAANATLPETINLEQRTPDWVELYNGTTTNISLAGLSLTDDTLQPRRFVFTNGAQIAAGSYYRVYFSANIPAGSNSAGFGLKATGGGVYLFDQPGRGGALVNSVIYGIQTPDFSIGRIPDGGTNWLLASPTPGTPNVALPGLGDPASLKINEWMADPGPGKNDWFELYNPGNTPVAIGGMYLTDNLSSRTKHQVAPLSFIGSGTNAWVQFIADGNTGAGADHVSFSLAASGEAVGISLPNGTLVDGVTFTQQVNGVSQGRFPDGSTNIVAFPGTDSPAAANYRMLTTIVINEALTHTDEPLEDAVELYNTTGQAIDISGWWLSDDPGTPQKYQIPFPTVVPAHGYTVIFENHFTNRNEAATPFALSSTGDEVVLSTASNNILTGFRTSVKFGAAHNGVSFGRYVTSDHREEFVSMGARTFGVDNPTSVQQFRTSTGATNVYPRVGPVVISQIMYHPTDDGTNDNVADEFIEIQNTSLSPVPLFDPAAPTNTWRLRDAVDYDFPMGITLQAGASIIAVSFDPESNAGALASFREKFEIPPDIRIYGPYSGKLANSDAKVELYEPDVPNTNGVVPYVLVERVHYFDSAPWPNAADGLGSSLRRVSLTGFADDPTNWVAAVPSFSGDADGDGLPDWWETQYGLNVNSAADAVLDSDHDGLSNLQEFLAGTSPVDPADALRVISVSPRNGSEMLVTFRAKANRSYTVEYKDSLNGSWTRLIDVPATPSDHDIQLTTPAATAARFYRLRTPRAP